MVSVDERSDIDDARAFRAFDSITSLPASLVRLADVDVSNPSGRGSRV
jgi:hypothetical protein